MATPTSLQDDASEVNIGIDKKSRKEISTALSHVLAETYSLQLKTLYYHWNVTGPLFQSLHILFQEQYNMLPPAVDELAERIRVLGFVAPGTYRDFAELSSIKEDKQLPADWQVMVKNLVAAHEAVARCARVALKKAQAASDEGTVDILVGRIQEHEKTAWMLRSLLERK